MNLVQLAYEVAEKAHKGQTLKDKVTPYITHPVAVCGLVEPTCLMYGFDFAPELEPVGLLHDVLEDTSYTEADMRVAFGDTITNAVVALTKKPGQSYDTYLSQVMSNRIAAIVKLADLRHNSDVTRSKDTKPETIAKYHRAYHQILYFLKINS